MVNERGYGWDTYDGNAVVRIDLGVVRVDEEGDHLYVALTPDQLRELLNEVYADWSELPDNERCPVCGQPDNCGDCTHEPLTPEQVKLLKGQQE